MSTTTSDGTKNSSTSSSSSSSSTTSSDTVLKKDEEVEEDTEKMLKVSPSATCLSTQTIEELLVTINKLKDLGNKHFQEHEFHKAIEEYNNAIECFEVFKKDNENINEANNVIGAVYNNRAFAYFKIEMYGATIADSTKAIALKFYKGYYRRGCAHAALMQWGKAKRDFQKAVNIFKSDLNIKKKLQQAEQADSYQKFCKAIETDKGKSILETLRVENFPSPDSSYDGPKFSSITDINEQWVVDLQQYMKNGGKLHVRYALQIMMRALEIFRSSPNVVHYDLAVDDDQKDTREEKEELTKPTLNISTISVKNESAKTGKATRITVCGDVHGQFYDMMNIFKLNGMPSTTNPYLFNGDFVDRGSWSLEVILVMLAWKCVLPSHFMMVRGNHESKDMNAMYGFKGEVEHKYDTRIYEYFCELFNWLPLAYVLGKKIFVCHGGLFKEDHVKVQNLQQLNRVCQPSEGNINPPKEASIMADLLWSDPQPVNGRAPSKRGGGIMFGPDITKAFLKENNLQMIIRSHEVEEEGFKLHHGGQLVTIFSAPNYVDSMGNKGAYILLDRSYSPSYHQFTAVEHPNVKPMAYAGGPMSFMNFM